MSSSGSGYCFARAKDASSLSPCQGLGFPAPAEDDLLLFSVLDHDEKWNKKFLSPVVVQPAGVGASTCATAVLTQAGGEWSSGLFTACNDKVVCIGGACCLACLECHLASRYGECFCLPLLPGSTLALRAGIRERHKIEGTIGKDWLAVHCCWPFAVCQMARELKRRTPTQIYKVATPPPPLKDATA
ncbi:PLAC8-like protein 1 [Rhinatrema bivittatum]|uniref:PLAC8-like protein 1 n=1 Tax=Rhinatrema bivittatum TaxID=194408 RepID=UPI00112D1165|nr:PLAC8-like protein 1 [Rhinatrema bivittatum]